MSHQPSTKIFAKTYLEENISEDAKNPSKISEYTKTFEPLGIRKKKPCKNLGIRRKKTPWRRDWLGNGGVMFGICEM